jgi:hypothetical protein
MPRVGLVRFAAVAYDVARAVVPAYRTPKSKHTFTQPQLLAVLCLMRFDRWTFRDAEVRLAEHAELRRALGLGRRVPDHTTLWRFFARLDDGALHAALAEVVRRFGPPAGPRGRGRRALTLALDATGLATGALSTFWVRREYEIRGQVRERAYWLKWLVLADVTRQLILAQAAHRGPRNDSRAAPRLLAAAPLRDPAIPGGLPVAWVLADREFDSERNHAFIHEVLGARSAIPARGAARRHRTPHRRRMAAAFPAAAYRRRVLVETTFSTCKRTQGGLAPGRSEATQVRQALLGGLAFNLNRLRRTAA